MTITAVSKYAALKNIKVAPSGTECCIDVDINVAAILDDVVVFVYR
jgi:hypothetical protein